MGAVVREGTKVGSMRDVGAVAYENGCKAKVSFHAEAG